MSDIQHSTFNPQHYIVGLIGDPVAHSVSPAMHNAAFAQLGMAARYELWPTPTSQLAARIAGLRVSGVLGANVTLPHKQAVLPLLDQLDPAAALIGAVNTVVRRPDGSLVGYNTDAPAVLDTLRDDAQFEPRGTNVVVLGASGAARAVCWALLQAEVAQITVVNRTLERAEALLADLIEGATNPDDPRLLVGELPGLVALAPNDAALPPAVAAAALVVNVTSLGWKDGETPLDAALLAPGVLVFDTVYRPTTLLRAAAARGGRTLDGLGMLVRQGARAFALWTGQPAPLQTMWQAARAALDHM